MVHITLVLWGMLEIQAEVLELPNNNGKSARITAVGAEIVVLPGALMIHLLLPQQSIIEEALEEVVVVHIFLQHLLQKQ